MKMKYLDDLKDGGIQHGSKKQGEAIIALLKKNNIDVLVSRQFGKNIKLIADALTDNLGGYPLLTIKEGIIKSTVKKFDK
ncbi:MAG: hypothetical protein KAH09_04315 [Desulfobacula sp.]|nr:hypothetical protein [Desulfobacula sp.]